MFTVADPSCQGLETIALQLGFMSGHTHTNKDEFFTFHFSTAVCFQKEFEDDERLNSLLIFIAVFPQTEVPMELCIS